MDMKEIKETVQSAHLNFLLGSGLSTPFLPVLGDIEARLSGTTDKAEKIKIKKEYFKKIIIPNLEIINGEIKGASLADLDKTYKNYKQFFELIGHILLKRKTTILSKQANIFTTNIDILIETVLENIGFEHNDGFIGRLNSTFSLSNFKKSIQKRSLHFENVSEIPVFNLIKIHGSLTWNKVKDKIMFSKLEHIDKSMLDKKDEDFNGAYSKLAIVNPEKKKLEETVIDIVYYELLRMYSSELEKENVVLFIMGFSMDDEHVREITVRAANSNPTLKVYVFCHSKDTWQEMNEKLDIGKLRYSNIELIGPDNDTDKVNFDKINDTVFKNILDSVENEE